MGAFRWTIQSPVDMDTHPRASSDYPSSSVTPDGRFAVGIHRPSYRIANLRRSHDLALLGKGPDGREVYNSRNFPIGDIDVASAGLIFEIANPLPFRGATFIGKEWADERARQPQSIGLPPRPPVSLRRWIREVLGPQKDDSGQLRAMLAHLPNPLRLAVATTSTDAGDLEALAELSAAFMHTTDSGRPTGLRYTPDETGNLRPDIRNHALYEAVANNPYLPDDYKTVMVLRPGVQGDSPITGEWGGDDAGSHVYEYLRYNSYIPWGHFAANMAEDAIRYDPDRLKWADVCGMRHLYFQRTVLRIAGLMGLGAGQDDRAPSPERLESLRQEIQDVLAKEGQSATLPFNATLWGWNLGFDYAPSAYRLHASHQQAHQQYALIPREVERHAAYGSERSKLPAYACGDLVHRFVRNYRQDHGVDFFEAYLHAIQHNERLDGRPDREASLIVHADRHVMLFVPKAQTSQWELQLVTLSPVGNILEADRATRQALDQAVWIAIRTLGAMGARLVTTIEYAKRFDNGPTGQRLLYSFLPRLPESPGAFSEAQLRWIVGHYPEDFAAACRARKPGRLPQPDAHQA